MAYIYKITNTLNNKVYIGQTSFSVEKRWQEHIKDSKRENLKNRPLYAAFHKYGIENFIIEKIEETDNPNEREQYWIKQYNSYSCGYNATTGGEGHPKDFSAAELEQIISLYNQKTAIKDIAAIVGYDFETIRNKLLSLGYQIDNHRNLKKAVYQIDKKTNAIINTFPSCHDAARFLGDDRKNAHIRECCQGLRKSAYGYRWQFVEDIAGEWHGNTISGS